MRLVLIALALSVTLAACQSNRPISPSESLGDTGPSQDSIENRDIEGPN
jgi:hypothetical protein